MRNSTAASTRTADFRTHSTSRKRAQKAKRNSRSKAKSRTSHVARKQRKHDKQSNIERRIYKKELMELTGWGETWVRILEKQGRIPEGRVDPGGKRKWWPESEAKAIVAGSA